METSICHHLFQPRKGSVLWSLDNRRLYALQLVAMDLWPRPCRVRCLSRERLPRHKLKTQYRSWDMEKMQGTPWRVEMLGLKD